MISAGNRVAEKFGRERLERLGVNGSRRSRPTTENPSLLAWHRIGGHRLMPSDIAGLPPVCTRPALNATPRPRRHWTRCHRGTPASIASASLSTSRRVIVRAEDEPTDRPETHLVKICQPAGWVAASRQPGPPEMASGPSPACCVPALACGLRAHPCSCWPLAAISVEVLHPTQV